MASSMSRSSGSSCRSFAPVVICCGKSKIYINDPTYLPHVFRELGLVSDSGLGKDADSCSSSSGPSECPGVPLSSSAMLFNIYDPRSDVGSLAVASTASAGSQTEEDSTAPSTASSVCAETQTCFGLSCAPATCTEAFSQTDDLLVVDLLTVEASTQSDVTVEYITALENDLNLLSSKTCQMLSDYEQLVIKYEALHGKKVAIASDAVGGDCAVAQDADATADKVSSRWADSVPLDEDISSADVHKTVDAATGDADMLIPYCKTIVTDSNHKGKKNKGKHRRD
eukprot:TRINITY_DN21854_c0_g3_i1.p1 TRINITY_DN21854_c0_g3~~TRINITY_DN21854_c0_g3_i1.p1  ORF type:complete len:283 (-),score=32.27 TRINITY_DN21854_c0_g3_i1:140-988(-)